MSRLVDERRNRVARLHSSTIFATARTISSRAASSLSSCPVFVIIAVKINEADFFAACHFTFRFLSSTVEKERDEAANSDSERDGSSNGASCNSTCLVRRSRARMWTRDRDSAGKIAEGGDVVGDGKGDGKLAWQLDFGSKTGG